jgi:hypothetical protein
MTSLVRHFKHSGIGSNSDTAQAPVSETGGSPPLEGNTVPPENADPLLRELGQLRKIAQAALAHAARTRNPLATASLLRAANGLLDLLARIEKAKGRNSRRNRLRRPHSRGRQNVMGLIVGLTTLQNECGRQRPRRRSVSTLRPGPPA